MLTDFEKFLYNEHLKISRISKGQLFKFRQDFSKIEPDKVVYLKRISSLITRLPNIKPSDYFKAPYELYGIDEYFDLKFFTTQKALKTYSIFVKNQVNQDPDSNDILQKVVDSLKFLKSFLLENNLSLEDYITHKTNNLPTFLLHLKNRSIMLYTLLDLPQVEAELKVQDRDVIKFMFDDQFYTNINVYRVKFLNSKKCKVLVREGIKKIKKNK